MSLLLRFSRARWVDDFYGPECDENAEHTRSMFVRLVRCILGFDAIADSKTASGNPLPILGVLVEAREEGIRMRPEQGKRMRWKFMIQEALDKGASHMCPSEASGEPWRGVHVRHAYRRRSIEARGPP